MTKLLKYLKGHGKAVIIILILMIVQAYCDLSLPSYTSDIVDVGIQQGGIDSVVMKEMRPETFAQISLFLEEQDAELFASAYEQNEQGNYALVLTEEEGMAQLEEILALPEMMLYSMKQSKSGQEDQMDIEQLMQAVAAGLVTKEQILEQKEKALEQMSGISDSIIQQTAIQFVTEEYKAVGMNMKQLQRNYLLSTGAKMLGMTLVMAAAAVCVGFVAARTGASIGRDLRERIFKKVISFSSSEINQFSTASLITRSTNDIQQVQMVTVMLLRMIIYAPILGIGGILKVTQTKTGMSWIIAVAVAIVLVLVLVLMKVAMPKFKIMQILVDKLNLVSRELITGVPVVRAFSREKHEEERFDQANRELMSTQLFTNRVMNVMMPVMMLTMNCITLLIVWTGAKGIDMGNLQVGDMMAFMTYTMQIVMAFLMLTMVSVMLPRAGVAAQRIEEVLNTEPGITDKEKCTLMTESCKGVLEFHDVSFQYPGAEEHALEHISFRAEPGKTTAIIGSTGCGKSTIMHLIPRFYDVTAGKITLDGVDIRDISQKDLRSMLGFVPQKGVLFSGTIRSNLKFGGEDITDEEIKKAAGIAQASEFIEAKPDQYDSEISQGGTNVSGGQKQRLSIARAIAKKPKVFLFDDSFSALDYKTDTMLRRALKESTADAAVIIVAQRISTILHAEQILVLDEGRIIGQGTHEELLESCPAYREIAASQLSEQELQGKGGVQ